MLIGIFGLSGVGKSTILRRVELSFKNIKCLSASQLLYKTGEYISYSNLTYDIAINNQYVLVNNVNHLIEKSTYQNYCLELHMLLETQKELIFIPSNCLKAMNLDTTIFLYDTAENIFSRRKRDQKERVQSSIQELQNTHEKSIAYYKKIFNNKNSYIAEVNNLEYIFSIIKSAINQNL